MCGALRVWRVSSRLKVSNAVIPAQAGTQCLSVSPVLAGRVLGSSLSWMTAVGFLTCVESQRCWKTRRAAGMGASRCSTGHGCPVEKSRRDRQSRLALIGERHFFGYFLCASKESNPPFRAERSCLNKVCRSPPEVAHYSKCTRTGDARTNAMMCDGSCRF
jgi:hypothetical protein